MRPLATWLFYVLGIAALRATNPIVEGVGLCDPQVRVYDDHVYLYATHDAAPGSSRFVMHDWWVWFSDDLVHWTQRSVLTPQETYWKKPSNECWATDAIRRNGKYYFYFSRGPEEIGVVESGSPVGPWKDPLGKPLVAKGSTPTKARDPGILQEEDGTSYIVFGCWDYYLARLGDNLTSLAEKPRKLEVSPLMGPYGPGKTDDKPFLFQRGGKYYLSWGCYYAMADDVYGPYAYKGCLVEKSRVEPAFQKALTMDRHGSFFELYNQWYFICNDQSWPGTSAHFRDSVLSYVHFRDNGEMAPVEITRVGVGEYDARNVIEAENYFRGLGVTQRESPGGGFEVRSIQPGTALVYPNVSPVPANASLRFRLSSPAAGAEIEVRSGSETGPLLGRCAIPNTGEWDHYETVSCRLQNAPGKLDLVLVFRGASGDLAHLDSLRFK